MRMPALSANQQKLILIIALSAVYLVTALWISYSQDYMVNGDFFESWLAGRALWTGVDMYNPDSWGPAHNIYGNVRDRNDVYPFPAVFALVFAPLGLLPLPVAVVIWVFTSLWLLTLSVIALWRTSGLGSEAKYLLPILAGVFLFRPTMVTLRNGQNGVLFLFVLVAIALLWQRRRWFSGGFLLAFFLIRPNIGVPLMGLVGLWLLLTRNGRAIVGFFSGVACLLLISQVMSPNWIEPWLGVGNNKLLNTFGYHPNLWGLVGWLSGHNLLAVIWIGLFLALVVIGMTVLWLRSSTGKTTPLAALAVTIPASMFIAPYMWAYDQVLFIFSIVVCAGELVKLNMPYLIPTTLHIFVSIAALVLLAVSITVGEDSLGGLLSLLVTGLVYIALRARVAAAKMP